MTRMTLFPCVCVSGLCLVAACANDAPRSAAPDSVTKTVAVQSSVQPAVAAEARAVCDTVAQKWRAIPSAVAAVRDTIARPVNRNSIDQALAAEELPATPACVVSARSDSGLPEGMVDPYWSPPAGWAPLWILSADGPDGGMLTYQRELVRCEVRNGWDGGDDSDTTYVPLPWREQTTVCWRHNRFLVPSDTGAPR